MTKHTDHGRTPDPLKRVVIKEEMIALTGHYVEALILNQFLYWGKRVGDFDQFIAEEKRRDPELNIEATHGWIYKTATDLNDELMLGMSAQTILRHIEPLVERGWLEKRHNPKYAWDRTWQYRPNIRQIQLDLQNLGYALEHYPLVTDAFSTVENASAAMENLPIPKTEDRIHQNGTAIPEITTETTTQITGRKEPAPTGAEPEPPSPAQERLAGLRSRLGSDPFTMAANCAQAQKEEGHIWTVPVEAGGTDTAGELMLAAWFKAKGFDPATIPKKTIEKLRTRLSKLAQSLESITPQQAARAVELVLDKRNPEFAYYTYSDPAIEKFKRDWTEVALRLLSGQPGYQTVRPPGDNGDQGSGPDKVRRVMERRGILS